MGGNWLNIMNDKTRLLSKLLPKNENGCIEWGAWRQPSGHGQAFYLGRLMPAHRAVYMALTGAELETKQHVCHKCDNPACCNIEHLFLGSAVENMRDMVAKGRHASQKGTQNCPRGSACHRSKLTDCQVNEIRSLLERGFGPAQIKKLGNYPVSISGISKIKHNQSRKQYV